MKPENRFIQAIHRRLSREVYFEKTHQSFHGGMPDVFYEGSKAMLWIEYKWLRSKPVRAFTPDLSKLQHEWLKRNHKNGHNPWIIVGFPGKSGFILDEYHYWETFKKQLLLSKINKPLSLEEIAEAITQRTVG
jgi:hypothetical protein